MITALPVRAKLVLFVCAGVFAACIGSAATFVVDSAGDEPDSDLTDGLCKTALGTCTLRAAIQQANALAGADTIDFSIPGPGVHTISPASPLPALTDDAGVTIDGYTQSGAKANTLAIGSDAVLLIELEGTNAGTGSLLNGLMVKGTNASIRGLVINRFARSGIEIEGGYGHQVSGCFLGTDPTGRFAQGNVIGLGVDFNDPNAVSSGSPGSPPVVVVGGLNPGDRNLLSGNASLGVAVSSASNCVIQNNYVGTDSSGQSALANQGGGVQLISTNVTVGGTVLFGTGGGPGTGNVVSGNLGSGIFIMFGGVNFVSGNLIGTNARGAAALPNGTGVQVLFGSYDYVYDNLISGNSVHGIRVNRSAGTRIEGNRIGTDLSGTSPISNLLDGINVVNGSSGVSVGASIPNTIAFNSGSGVSVGVDGSDVSNDNRVLGNSIHDNGGLGIDLGSDGVTPNNDCDTGRGPNLLQNHPVLETAAPVGTSTRIRGTLNSVANADFTIEFFANRVCDSSGYGEGETFLRAQQVTTDASCNAIFEVVLPLTVPPGSFITATATDLAGNTSEFSACIPVTSGLDFYTVAPCRVVDTRNPSGAYGGPALGPSADRSFVIAGQCGIPPDARAVAFNFTVTQPTASGDVQLFPGGTPTPVPASVYYSSGQTRAKTTVLALGPGGDIGTHIDQQTGTADLVIDVTGYFR